MFQKAPQNYVYNSVSFNFKEKFFMSKVTSLSIESEFNHNFCVQFVKLMIK